jgi:hypothetical protein
MKTYLDNKFADGEDSFQAIYAGFACWAAARTVLLDPEPRTGVTSEREFDAEEWDASFLASLAYSGGATWEVDAGDLRKRREYWMWFITSAVPEARGRL